MPEPTPTAPADPMVKPLEALRELIGGTPAEVLSEALSKAYEVGRDSAKEFPKVTLYPWICPHCDGKGRWESGERCLHCAGYGLTDDVKGWPAEELTAAPRPPAVMARPCVDCAYRPGSPEDESSLSITLPGPDKPFFCHHGLHRVGDGYVGTACMGELPLGAMVCAGWWAVATGGQRPDKPFRDPGGSDRRAAAPKTLEQHAAEQGVPLACDVDSLTAPEGERLSDQEFAEWTSAWHGDRGNADA